MAITQKTVDKLYKEQRGCCAFCHRPFTGNNPQQVYMGGKSSSPGGWINQRTLSYYAKNVMNSTAI